MTDEPTTFARAADHFGRLLHQVPADAWGRPTPCSLWDVRALTRHVVEEVLWIPELFAGHSLEEVGDRFAGDILGEDPVNAWDRAVTPAVATVTAPGAMDRICALSMGPTPGDEYARQLGTDLVVHAWDLARATGLDETLDADLVAAALAYSEPWVPMLANLPDYFAPPIEPESGADDQTRLLNRLGRRP